MKHTLLVVVASAAIGAAAALYFTPQPPPARPAAPLDVRALQLALERALESAGFGSQARAAAWPPAAPSEGAPSPTHEEPADPRGSASPDGRAQGAAALPPANRAVVESLAAFDDDEPLRRAWLFRSERDVIAWLGTPDLVMYEAGGERWHYSKQDGSIVVAFFARGRLLNIMK